MLLRKAPLGALSVTKVEVEEEVFIVRLQHPTTTTTARPQQTTQGTRCYSETSSGNINGYATNNTFLIIQVRPREHTLIICTRGGAVPDVQRAIERVKYRVHRNHATGTNSLWYTIYGP